MGQQFWPFGTFDWDEQWYWDISKKRYSMIIRDTYMTWPWLSQMDFHFSMREVETCCNNTYINSRRREGNNHSHALASRLCKTLRMFHIQYPLWISLNQWSHPKASPVSGLNYVHSTRINFCQPFFCSKEPGIYIYKQAVKSLRTNVFQEWDRGGDRPAPWEFGLFHSWRLARSFGFRVLANRWFLVSTLGLNWREGSVCVDARLRSFKVFWL